MYNIFLDEKQIKIIKDALDFYSRLGCGQVWEIDLFFRQLGRVDNNGKALDKLEDVKDCYFPDLFRMANYPINSEKVPEKIKIAYEMFQVIRNRVFEEDKEIIEVSGEDIIIVNKDL